MRWRAYAVPAVLATLLGVLLAGVATAAVPATSPMPVAAATRLFAFADPRIGESSGLVDTGRWMITANDSGNPADVFVVDPRSGRTIGITHLRVATTDVEALAPAGPGRVWVADIGDNTRTRRSLALYLVPIGPGRRVVDPRPLRLVYPDGRHDAESLFTDRAGHVYLISKSLQGGTVYRMPTRLWANRLNRLVPIARVPDLATDAAMMLDGTHVLVRSYGIASIYTFPQFRLVGRFALPRQPQGEGISVGPQGRIRLSSEGRHSVVLQITLPAAIWALLHPASAPTPTPSATPSAAVSAPSASASPSGTPGSAERRTSAGETRVRRASADTVAGMSRPWLYVCVPLVLLLGAIGIGLGLRGRGA